MSDIKKIGWVYEIGSIESITRGEIIDIIR
nr:MAG TPA: hypothetical protein [Caudoviricetes sp.]